MEFSKRAGVVVCLSLAAAAAGACSDNDNDADNGNNNLNTQADVNAAMAAGQASGQTLGAQAQTSFGAKTTVVAEGNVASIVHTLNDGEIAEASLVLGLTTDPSAIAFADRIIQDHTASNQMLDSMLSVKGLTVVDNPVSLALRNQIATEVQNLKDAAASSTGSGTGSGVINTGSARGSVAYMYLQQSIQEHEQGFVLFGMLIQISASLKFDTELAAFLATQQNLLAQHRDDATRRLQNL